MYKFATNLEITNDKNNTTPHLPIHKDIRIDWKNYLRRLILKKIFGPFVASALFRFCPNLYCERKVTIQREKLRTCWSRLLWLLRCYRLFSCYNSITKYSFFTLKITLVTFFQSLTRIWKRSRLFFIPKTLYSDVTKNIKLSFSFIT